MRLGARLIRALATCVVACLCQTVAAAAQSGDLQAQDLQARCQSRDPRLVDRAIEACSQIIAASDGQGTAQLSARVARARGYVGRAEWRRAVLDLDQVLERDSTSRLAAEAYSLRAIARYQLTDFAGAIADSDAALKLDRHNVQALKVRSFAHAGRGTASSAARAGSLPDALLVYVAHGPAGACGEGCEEWLAVEGTVDWEGPRRVIAALDRLGARKLPVVLNLPRARHVASAMTIGKILRERGFDVTVGETRVNGCDDPRDAGCVALKQAGKPVQAALVPMRTCNILCVLGIAGGTRRTVPETTRVVIGGMWMGNRLELRADAPFREGRHERDRNLIKIYLTQMGVDPQVADMMDENYDSSHATELSREDAVRLRIITQ